MFFELIIFQLNHMNNKLFADNIIKYTFHFSLRKRNFLIIMEVISNYSQQKYCKLQNILPGMKCDHVRSRIQDLSYNVPTLYQLIYE